MAIHTRTPSLFRPQQRIDQSVLTENRKLVEDIDRRGLLRGAVSLGALTMLTGCDVSEIEFGAEGFARGLGMERQGPADDLPISTPGADIYRRPGAQAAAV